MERIVIIGNSGSGKSFLARKLADHFGYPLIQLDSLYWEPGGFGIKRPNETVYAEIATLSPGKTWVVEGVFGELAKEFFAFADYLTWLDLNRETCLSSLRQRGAVSDIPADKQFAEESFQKLLTWAAAYWERQDLRSHRGHQQLFDDFSGNKIRLRSRQAANHFLASIRGGRT